MKTLGRMLVPGLLLAAATAGEPSGPAMRPEPEATGTAGERASKSELRPTQDAPQAERRPAVRVILPSPYPTAR